MSPGPPKTTTLRDKQKQLTRRRLLRAARQLFETRGFGATTIDEIATRAGASRPTFYAHFATKQDLLREVIDDILPEVMAKYDALDAVLACGSRREMRAWLDDLLTWFERRRALMAAAEQASILSDPASFPDVRRSLSNIGDTLQEFIAGWPSHRRKAARVRVKLLVVHLGGVVQGWAIHDWGSERELVLDALADIWHDALTPPSG